MLDRGVIETMLLDNVQKRLEKSPKQRAGLFKVKGEDQ